MSLDKINEYCVGVDGNNTVFSFNLPFATTSTLPMTAVYDYNSSVGVMHTFYLSYDMSTEYYTIAFNLKYGQSTPRNFSSARFHISDSRSSSVIASDMSSGNYNCIKYNSYSGIMYGVFKDDKIYIGYYKH